MEKFYINANFSKDVRNSLTIVRYLTNKYDLEETMNPLEADLIISIGGDGTFLKSAKLNPKAKLFGINKGTLGYLTEIEENKFEEILDRYIKGSYEIKERMMLDCNFKKSNRLAKDIALNDIVISKKDSSLINLDIYVNNIKINSYYADGLIISTPTGSTGYSLSCGGPIVDPSSKLILITPIAPHTLINRSIIIEENSEIMIQLTNTRTSKNAKLSIDGREESIMEGDYITIKKSEEKIKFVSFSRFNFLEKVKEKML